MFLPSVVKELFNEMLFLHPIESIHQKLEAPPHQTPTYLLHAVIFKAEHASALAAHTEQACAQAEEAEVPQTSTPLNKRTP